VTKVILNDKEWIEDREEEHEKEELLMPFNHLKQEPCRCFWSEDGQCLLGEDNTQENCPFYANRINPQTGEAWGPVNKPPGWPR